MGDEGRLGVDEMGAVLTAKQVKDILHCSLRHAHDLFDRGEVEGYRDGRNKRYFLRSLMAYIERNRNTPKASSRPPEAPAAEVKRRSPSPARPLPQMGSVALEFLSRVKGDAGRSGGG